MSNSVSALVERRRVGSPTKKSILLFMADKASDDGSGIWIGQGTIAARLELSKRAVQKNTQALIEDGLIFPVGKKSHTNGYTVNYSIDLVVVRDLPDVKRNTNELNSPVNVVRPTGETTAPHAVNHVHPNLTGTIQEPPTRINAREAVDSEFEKVWYAYPSDRQRGKSTCREQFAQAIQQSVSPEDILEAVRAYARESDGFTRSKVCFSDNWFREERWKAWLAGRAERAKARPDAAVVDEQLASHIRNRKPWVVSSVSAHRARQLIAAGRVTTAECRAAGVSI